MAQKKTLLEALKERRLVCDGAMGTQLMLAGLENGACGEMWNLTHPERVLAIQKALRQRGGGLHHHELIWRKPREPQAPRSR